MLSMDSIAVQISSLSRAYATVLRLSSLCNVCIVAKLCVLEQKLLLTAYIGSRI